MSSSGMDESAEELKRSGLEDGTYEDIDLRSERLPAFGRRRDSRDRDGTSSKFLMVPLVLSLGEGDRVVKS